MPAQYLQFIALLVVLGAILWLLQWVMNRQARRSEGLNVPDTSEVDGEMHNPSRVYYFYSRTCGPCKAMEALTTRVCEESDNLIRPRTRCSRTTCPRSASTRVGYCRG